MCAVILGDASQNNSSPLHDHARRKLGPPRTKHNHTTPGPCTQYTRATKNKRTAHHSMTMHAVSLGHKEQNIITPLQDHAHNTFGPPKTKEQHTTPGPCTQCTPLLSQVHSMWMNSSQVISCHLLSHVDLTRTVRPVLLVIVVAEIVYRSCEVVVRMSDAQPASSTLEGSHVLKRPHD